MWPAEVSSAGHAHLSLMTTYGAMVDGGEHSLYRAISLRISDVMTERPRSRVTLIGR